MRSLCLALLMFYVAAAAAESVYVDDKLRVGVRSKPESREAPIEVVTTGAQLDVIERQGGYLHVRTPDGVDGWVNSIYVTSEPPARLRIKDLREEHDRLTSEIEQLRDSSSDLMDENDRLTSQANDLMRENGSLHSKLSRLYAASRPQAASRLWLYLSGAMVLLFLGGFLLGTRWHRRRVERRLGGMSL